MEDIEKLFPTKEEMEEARREALIFHTEACRAAMMNAALDIAQTMKENGVSEGEACLVTGAVQFAVELWDKLMRRAGNTPLDSRRELERQVKMALSRCRKNDTEEEQDQATAH
jgi:hypothetical protein